MQYRKLGNSGLKVSEISLGSWLTYGGYVGEDPAVRSIEQAYDLGVNFFDTANVYERGEAEQVMGKVLSAYPRESYVLATKVFGKMGEGPNDRGLSRKHIKEQAEASLRRLNADYIDIYYCHRFDPETPLEETLRALDDLVTQGKVLYIGVSEWTPAQIVEAYAIADKLLIDKLIVNQPVYNMFNRYIEKDIIPLGEAKGFGQVVFSPLAQGLLTGKYRAGQPIAADSRASSKNWDEKQLSEASLHKVAQLSGIADELGIKVSQLAIAWILRQNNVSSALVGASRPEQVIENCSASGIRLTDDVLSSIETILQG
jgi:voltage-dependent potassium channel beta subunit